MATFLQWAAAIALVAVALALAARTSWGRTKSGVFFSKVILPWVLEPALIYYLKHQGREDCPQALGPAARWRPGPASACRRSRRRCRAAAQQQRQPRHHQRRCFK